MQPIHPHFLSVPKKGFVLSVESFLKTKNSDKGRGDSCRCACVCAYRLDVASGVNALISVKNASLMTLAKCFGIFPFISKVLEVCDGVYVFDLRETTKLFDFLPPLRGLAFLKIFYFGFIVLSSAHLSFIPCSLDF